MSSQKQKNSNRLNGRKSRGPKTEAGRRRSSQNALAHGLSLPISADPQLSSRAERLAQLIAGPQPSPYHLHEARVIAEAQIELQRVRGLRLERMAHPSVARKPTTLKSLRAMIKLLESSALDVSDQLKVVDGSLEDLLPEVEAKLELHIGSVIGSLHLLDRYERRALSKRKLAMRSLHEKPE